jgi:hypothetical protein
LIGEFNCRGFVDIDSTVQELPIGFVLKDGYWIKPATASISLIPPKYAVTITKNGVQYHLTRCRIDNNSSEHIAILYGIAEYITKVL